MSGSPMFTPAELEALVLKMRELGVEEACGVVLGRPPLPKSKVDSLKEEGASPEELAKARREQRLEEARQDLCDKLNYDRDSLSKAELAYVDSLLPPNLFLPD